SGRSAVSTSCQPCWLGAKGGRLEGGSWADSLGIDVLAKALRGVGDSVAIVGDAGIGNDDVGWGVVLLSFWSRATTVAASLSTSESSLATMSLEPSPLGRSLRASAAMSGSLAVAITATAALGMSLAVRP